eukprot:6316495-Prymnesium_polylepis.1
MPTCQLILAPPVCLASHYPIQYTKHVTKFAHHSGLVCGRPVQRWPSMDGPMGGALSHEVDANGGMDADAGEPMPHAARRGDAPSSVNS